MRCLVTAGPTWEPLDRVRRLTNFSTGSLGGGLANHLACAGHTVTLLLSETATWRAPLAAVSTVPFSTTATLEAAFRALATPEPTVIFHAAAVSDFTGGQAGVLDEGGVFQPLQAGKLSTRGGSLWVELRPTPKLLPKLTGWFPSSRIVGWKYEVDGDRDTVLAAAQRQFTEARNHACVVNGAAYGPGFGLLRVDGELQHLADQRELFTALTELAAAPL